LIDAACWGAALGGYSGYKIGNANGATGWDMAGYIAGGAAIGAVAGYAGAAVGTAAAAGLTGIEAAMAGGMMTGMTAGAINGAGMTALAGGDFGDVMGGMIQGAVVGGFSGLAGGAAFSGANQLLGNIPLHNTLSYMAGSTASQMTANVLTGRNVFEGVDYGLNPGIIVPLFADVGPRINGVRDRVFKDDYDEINNRPNTKVKERLGRKTYLTNTELQSNGDLNMNTEIKTSILKTKHITPFGFDLGKVSWWGVGPRVPVSSTFIPNYRQLQLSLILGF